VTATDKPQGRPQVTPQIEAASVATPKGGGAISGLTQKLEPNPFDGTAGLRIDIPTQSPRGVDPGLALHYGSSKGNGVFGVGFDLSLPSFTRRSASYGIPRYDSSDLFQHSDLGTLEPRLDQSGHAEAPRLEPASAPVWSIELFRARFEKNYYRVEHWTHLDGTQSHWRVITGKNTTHIYGSSSTARIADPDNGARIAEWLLERTEDAHGNLICYNHCGAGTDANRYLSEVAFGRYSDAHNQPAWNMRVVFDYGGHVGPTPPPEPSQPPPDRPDVFSSFTTGFEVQTRWRCARVLVYATHPDLDSGKPVLTQTLQLDYTTHQSRLSMLKTVTQIGYRKQDNGKYTHQAMPPLNLGFSTFTLDQPTFDPLDFEGAQDAPGDITAGDFRMIDLAGEGAAGLLYSNKEITLYWQPLGDGRFAPPQPVSQMPNLSDLADTSVSLTSLGANGQQELVLLEAGNSGFFALDASPNAPQTSWSGFQKFNAVPTGLGSSVGQFADSNGDGYADLIEAQAPCVRTYPSKARAGFGPADTAPMPASYPRAKEGSPTQIETFADLIGDGLSHRIRIAQGQVDCWPSLGYGRFGPKRSMHGAPVFPGGLDAERLFMADLDGSGTTDLIYAQSDHVLIWMNQSGRGFAPSLRVELPLPIDALSRISFADIYGTGTSCLVLTRLAPTVQHLVCDFSARKKPYLLNHIDASMGSETRLTYVSSVQEYLQDKTDGRRWPTQMFFPVQLVAQIETLDQIAQTRTVQSYRYHDGYYDPNLRKFQGFGDVECWDSESFEDHQKAARSSPVDIDPLNPDIWSPTQYTHSWFHTGENIDANQINERNAPYYWHGDKHAADLPLAWLAPEFSTASPNALRLARASMAGHLLRKEVFGLDASALEKRPYSVTQACTGALLIQPQGGNSNAVVWSYTRETLDTVYERETSVPRVQHDVTLAVDPFGNPTERVKIGYGARQAPPDTALPYPEQTADQIVFSQVGYATHAWSLKEPYRWTGLACEDTALEVLGAPTTGRIYDFDGIRSLCKNALKNTLAYGEPPPKTGLGARRFDWSRSYYWDEALSKSLELGDVAFQGLVHHGERAVFTPDLITPAFGTRVSDKMLTDTGGYAKIAGYWWNRGLIQYYATDPSLFYQPVKTDGQFGSVVVEDPLNQTTGLTYDKPGIFLASVSRYLTGAPGSDGKPAAGATALTTHVVTDPQCGHPAQISDPNGTTTQIAYCALGMMEVSTIIGQIDGKAAGDAPLSERSATPTPTVKSICKAPDSFLHGSTHYYFYDLTAWSDGRGPTATVHVTRQLHVHQLPAGTKNQYPVSVTYRDGSGRDLLTLVDNTLPASAGVAVTPRWVASGWERLDNKGQPVERIEPFFASGPDYISSQNLPKDSPPPSIIHYDALGRETQRTTPKGFLTRTDFAAWQTTLWDENDTVEYSPFFKSFPSPPRTPAQDREYAALQQAKTSFRTPKRHILDPLGRTVRVLDSNLGAITAATLAPAIKGASPTPDALLARLIGDGYLSADPTHKGIAWATSRLQPYLKHFLTIFSGQYGKLAEPLLAILRQTGLSHLQTLDIAGHVVSVTDPRLLADQLSGATIDPNIVHMLDMQGQSLRTNSVDAGPRRMLKNIFGDETFAWDALDHTVETTYDRLGRVVAVDVTDPGGGTPRRTEQRIYGEAHSDPEKQNLLGQIWRSYDDAGLETTPLYDLAGDAKLVVRQMRDDPTVEPDWTTAEKKAVAKAERLTTSYLYDAEQARISTTSPDGSKTTYTYDLVAQVIGVSTLGASQTVPNIIMKSAEYNALGQRVSLSYGNGAISTFVHEPTTNRLVHQHTQGPSAPGAAKGEMLEDVIYVFDPVGNLVQSDDSSFKTVFCFNQGVAPKSTFEYDPLYRLTNATGRQQSGLAAPSASPPTRIPFCPTPPGDHDKLTKYAERYTYDDGGNLVRLRHTAAKGNWTTDLAVSATNNHLKNQSYNSAGEQHSVGGSTSLSWDYRGLLARATLVERASGENDTEAYLYNSHGERLARVTRRLKRASKGTTPALYDVKESLFLDEYERSRSWQEDGTSRQNASIDGYSVTVAVDNDKLCVLQRGGKPTDTWAGRSLITGLTSSVSCELDDQGQRLSYREYLPFGSTAYVAANSAAAANSPYRYNAKRRDDATGLYYYGMRYYPPWQARWISPDPAGDVDGTNLYAYVGGNPMTFSDPTGTTKSKKTTTTMHGKTVKKPATHAIMHSKSYTVGRLIAQEIVASPTDHKARLKAMEKDIANIQIAAGLPLHNETQVDNAMKAGMAGNKDQFSYYFRAALPGMDEEISTATMYHIARGAGSVTMNQAQWKQFAYAFRIASRLRLETEYTGYKTKDGEVQHPTSAGAEFYASRGKGHTYWDRARREDVLDVGLNTSKTGVDRMLETVAEAARHSLAYGVAPSMASNAFVRGGVGKKRKRRQMSHREGIKRIYFRLRVIKPTNQKFDAKWIVNRGRAMSPMRIGY
jgi:RHS repeat-associated protein